MDHSVHCPSTHWLLNSQHYDSPLLDCDHHAMVPWHTLRPMRLPTAYPHIQAHTQCVAVMPYHHAPTIVSLPRHSCAMVYAHLYLHHMQPTATLHHCCHHLSLACHHHCCHLHTATTAVYVPPLLLSMCHHCCCLCATTATVYVPPPLPSTCLSLDAYMSWHMHTCTSTTCNATCLQSRDHSLGVFCSPSLLSNICSCYPQLPPPRPVTPKPNLKPASDNFACPCPTCHAGNTYGWQCPIPIPDPAIDQENVFDLDDGTPTGCQGSSPSSSGQTTHIIRSVQLDPPDLTGLCITLFLDSRMFSFHNRMFLHVLSSSTFYLHLDPQSSILISVTYPRLSDSGSH